MVFHGGTPEKIDQKMGSTSSFFSKKQTKSYAEGPERWREKKHPPLPVIHISLWRDWYAENKETWATER